MPTLDDVPVEYDPTRLLLIGDSKMGKSTYAAQCAKDGFTLLYVDSDNGISALRNAIKGDVEVMKRVIYFKTEKPCEFLEGLLEDSIFRWNLTQDKKFSSATAKPDDKMVEIIPSRIPKGILLVNDSWTSTALDAMGIAATDKKTTLENMGNDSQGVYGNAGMRLTLLLAIFQHCAFNILTIAHGTFYERYEKPIGKVADNSKQKDMILKETVRVPMSSSKTHGYGIAKYFTDIGWMTLSRANTRQLDFEVSYDRVGGGRPNRVGPLAEMSFKTLFGSPIPVDLNSGWLYESTAEEWTAVNKKPAAQPAGVTAGGELPKTPAKPGIGAMMLKR